MEWFKIIASKETGIGSPTTITIENSKGTFAEEVYEACERRFWAGVQKCAGCAYEDTEEWKMPCCQCRRKCKDYYLGGEDNGR